MRSLLLASLPAGVSVAAWSLTAAVHRYALDHRVLDVPNARSSHAVATPRGGGAAIVATVIGAYVVIGALGLLPRRVLLGFVGAGVFVSLVGFLDDHRHVPPRWRLLSHFVAAIWLLIWLDGFPPVQLRGALMDLGWAGNGLATIYVVWLINLTNFMDGIDGIAAVECITVSGSGVLLYLTAVPLAIEWWAPLILGAASLGFLLWNWPPAKIFMGDVGSGFLGLMLAALSFQAARVAPSLFWSWVILLGLFIVDATITLLRRVFRGEKFYEAHRTHAYQHAAQRFGHRSVTLVVCAINVCWLLPISMLVARGMLGGLTGVAIACAPLCVVAMWLRAGEQSTA